MIVTTFDSGKRILFSSPFEAFRGVFFFSTIIIVFGKIHLEVTIVIAAIPSYNMPILCTNVKKIDVVMPGNCRVYRKKREQKN